MNLGKILGGMLVLLGIALGITTFGITGASIGYTKLPELLGIVAGVSFLIGIIIFLSSIEKPVPSANGEIGEVQVFSERD